MSDGWANERFEIDRRLLLIEKTASSMMEHVHTSQENVASYFTSSPELKKLSNAAIKVCISISIFTYMYIHFYVHIYINGYSYLFICRWRDFKLSYTYYEQTQKRI